MIKSNRKILSLALALILLLSAFTFAPVARADVAIQEGLPGTITIGTGTEENPTIIGFGGRRWVVIGYNGAGVASASNEATLLFARGEDIDYTPFDSTGLSNEYSGSDLQAAMNYAYNIIPTNKEKALVVPRTLSGGSGNFTTPTYNENNIAGADVTDAKFWPLSAGEAYQVNSTVRRFDSTWWLRTPGITGTATCNNVGAVLPSGTSVSSPYYFPRPALKIDLSSVLFTSAASGAGAKPTMVGSGLTAKTAQTGAIKFTVQSASLSLTCSDVATRTVQAGDMVNIVYSGATTGTNNYVSCVIVNSSGNVLFYGKLATAASGTASFTVPAAANLSNGNYTIKLFSEEANGNNYTDFCSEPISIPMTVNTTLPTVSSVTPSGTGAAISGNVVITFSKPMDTATTGTVQLNSLAALTGGAWSLGNTVFTIPYSGLAYNTAHTVNISGFKDAAGNTMAANSSQSFTTLTDTTPPTVSSVTPSGTGAAISGNVVITFSKPMDTATTGTVQLNSLAALTGGAWSLGNTVFTIPYSGLAYNTAHTVNISGFKDAAGNTMAANSSQSFTTLASDASISPASAAFDRDAPADIPITLSPGSHTLSRITCDGSSLTGSEYGESGSVYTFDAAWLATLSNGSHTIQFVMSGGTNPTLTLTVSGVNFTATPGTINLNNPTDLMFLVDSALPSGLSFDGVQFMNVTAGTGFGASLDDRNDITFNPTTGTLTIPAAAFGQHASVGGGSPLTPGTYRAKIMFYDGISNYLHYYADFNLIDGSGPQPIQYTVAVFASPSSGGTVTGGGTFDENTSRTVTATANTDYRFINWTENGIEVSVNASYTFTLTANRNLVANFEYTGTGPEPAIYTIKASAGTYGNISPSGEFKVSEGDNFTFHITPDSGYTIDTLTVDGKTATAKNNTYTFADVQADHTIYVTFKEAPGPPQTGDDSNILLWMILGQSSILAELCMLVWRKRRSLKERGEQINQVINE